MNWSCAYLIVSFWRKLTCDEFNRLVEDLRVRRGPRSEAVPASSAKTASFNVAMLNLPCLY